MGVRRPAKRPREETSGLPGDERLLVEAAKKDPSCFAELYELNFARVYAYIVRRVCDRDAAQDLTSDVFHKALASIQSFEWRGVPFAGWLLRIAANMIIDRSKRSGREVPATDDVPDPVAQTNLEQIDHHARLFQLVEQLPPDQRRVIGMRFAEEKSIREIANELGRSEGAVKQLQFRALQNLRQRMEGANA
jgi:RNA polymerase sigma-70 factor (ECF subfamily)